MNWTALTVVAATLSCFLATRFVLGWLVPLIPFDRPRRRLSEPSASSLLTAILSVVAGLAAMSTTSTEVSFTTAAVQLGSTDSLPVNVATAGPHAEAVARLAAFVRKTERSAPAPMTPFPANHPAEGLADVDTMIARLAARLEADGSDADGWRTLGWSHFATENYAAAAKAYDRALALRPDDSELKQAAAEARARAAGEIALPVTGEAAADASGN